MKPVLSNFIIACLLVTAISGLGGCSSARKKELSGAERARLFVDVANASLNDGDAIGALESLLKAEQEDPELPELHHSRALAYAMKQDLATALVSAKKAVALAPKYSEANNTLGKILTDLGKYDEAVGPLLTAAKDPLYRDSYKPYTLLGILHYRKGEFPKSIQYLERAISDSPNNSCIAYYYRGHIRLRDSRFNEAIRDYEKATQRFCANFADAHLALGIAYEKNHQVELARKKFLEVQDRYPSTKVADQAVDHLRMLP